MPKFPTYDRQQGLSGGATASFQSAGAFAAPAQALADLGGSVADAGQKFALAQQKVRNSQGDTWLSRARAETALEMQTAQNELRQQATDGAQGYTDMVKARYEQVRQRYLKSAPDDRARQMFDEWSNSYSANVIGDAATFQAESTLSKRNDDFAKAMLAHSQVVLSDPSQYDAVAKRAMDDLAGAAQWMTPDQELKARSTVIQELQLARAKAEIQRDPAKFLQEIGVTRQTVKPAKVEGTTQSRGQQAMAFYMQKGYTKEQAAGIVGNLIGESNLNTGAVGDNGTAEGVAQWRGERLTRLKRFAASRGKDYKDFETQLDFVDLELQNNEKTAYQALKAAKTVDEATAAFIGYERPKGWTPGNPRAGHNYKGRLGYAAAMAGGDVVVDGTFSPSIAGDQRFSGLDVGQVLGLQQQAESQVAAISRQEQAAATAQLAQIKGSLQLGIATGDTNITPHTILSSPLLDDDKAQLINSLNEKQGDARLAAGAMAKIDAGEALNPFNADDKKGVSLAYEAATGGSSLFEEGPAQSVLGYMYGRSHILPNAAKNEIRAGLLSSDPARVVAAASMASQLADVDRGGLEAAENGDALLKAATLYKHMTQGLGLSNEETGRRMVDLADPEKASTRKAILESEPIKKALKDVSASDVAAIFDEGIFSKAPAVGGVATADEIRVGVNPEAEAAIVADYRSILQDSIAETGGDMEAAQELAASRFSRNYGVSELSPLGSSVVLKYPPEKAYPAMPDGSHDYIREQAVEALKAEGVTAEEIYLQAYDKTEDYIRAGKPARYQLFYRDDKGLQRYFLPFFADPNVAAAAKQERQREAETRMIDNRERFTRESAEDQRSLDETQGGDWMKARQLEMDQERRRQDESLDQLRGPSTGPINGGGGGGY